MVVAKLKILVGVIAIGLGIPVLVLLIGVVGHFGYIVERIGAGFGLVLGRLWAVWMN